MPKEVKEFFFARNQEYMRNRNFLDKVDAISYALPKGVIEKYCLIGDYYYFESAESVGTKRGEHIRNFGAELPGKKIHKRFIPWLLGIPE